MVAISSRGRRLYHSNCKEHHPIILMLKHSRILLPSLTHKILVVRYWQMLTDSQTGCKIYMSSFLLARVYFLLGTEIVAKSSAGHKGGLGVGGGSSPLQCPVSGVRAAPLSATTGGVSCNRNTRLTGCRSAVRHVSFGSV